MLKMPIYRLVFTGFLVGLVLFLVVCLVLLLILYIYIYDWVCFFRHNRSVLSVSFLVGGRVARGFRSGSCICRRFHCRWFPIFFFILAVGWFGSFFFRGWGRSMGYGYFFGRRAEIFWGIYSTPPPLSEQPLLGNILESIRNHILKHTRKHTQAPSKASIPTFYFFIHFQEKV